MQGGLPIPSSPPPKLNPCFISYWCVLKGSRGGLELTIPSLTKVGCLRTITNVLWGGAWVALEAFLRWDEALDGSASAGYTMGMGRGNEMIEIESGLNRVRKSAAHLLFTHVD